MAHPKLSSQSPLKQFLLVETEWLASNSCLCLGHLTTSTKIPNSSTRDLMPSRKRLYHSTMCPVLQSASYTRARLMQRSTSIIPPTGSTCSSPIYPLWERRNSLGFDC